MKRVMENCAGNSYSFLGMPVVVYSQPMVRLLTMVERIARVDAVVLITGESGAGKEVVARAIHHYSPRSRQPWVDVNCAALPEHLMESELFGHEKGAFSGAVASKPGLFELASHGTLFLDEIGDLDPRMQVKLLRVLDGASYYRLGGTRKVGVDVRVVAASNKDLGEFVDRGHLRRDLYHRLSQIQLSVPPLRQRRADIIPLAEFFLKQHQFDMELDEAAKLALENHHWPGNVRELRNVLVKAAVLAQGPCITIDDLPESVRSDGAGSLGALVRSVGNGGQVEAEDWNLEALERRMIFAALDKTTGHHQRAADLLGISRRTLSRKLKRYATEDK